MKMKSIKAHLEQTIEIKRSLFHTHLFPIESLEAVEKNLLYLRKLYPDATHYCYAYLLGDHQEQQKYEDDGEPSGTAGMPILEVLKKHGLTNVLCVVVRIYGGIKLGAGGLVRAYAKGPSELIKKATFTYLETVIVFIVEASYDVGGKFESFIRTNTEFIEAVYDANIIFKAALKQTDFQTFKETLKEASNGQLFPKIITEYTRYL